MENTKIPKVIHYCWFGENELDELSIKCIDSWKKILPDYEIKLWNEKNFNLNINQYVKDAYREKKWAFISDYVRLYALYHEGGIYMDTDVEVIKSFDSLLDKNIFLGFENKYTLSIGTIGAQKNNKWIKDLLDYYNEKSFYENNKPILIPNTRIITQRAIEQGLKLDNKYQVIMNDVNIYPKDYFIAKSYLTDKLEVTNNTFCIHHYGGSWINNKKSLKKFIKKIVIKVIGENTYLYVMNLKYSKV